MARMEWKDAYSVGNELLDSQHRQLIELVNQLTGETPLSDVLEGLRRYAETHFQTEEGLLEAAEYPELEEHQKYHAAFRSWLDDVIAAHESGGKSAQTRRDIHHYLCVWLANHLLVQDKAFESWLA